MKYLIAFILLFSAAGLFAYDHYNLGYWRMKPEARVDMKWAYEVKKFESKSKELKKMLLLLSDIQMTTTDQQFKELIDKSHPPFKKVPKGMYSLQVQIMPWVEEMKYGYLIQHEVFDSNKNKVNEFNINLDIGYLW